MTPFEDFVVCMMGAATILLILAAAKWEKSRGVGFVMAAISVVFLIGYVGFAVGRGGPKSVSTETKRPKEAEVLWMKGVKNVGVYAVLQWPGSREPKYYFFPGEKIREKAESASLEARVKNTALTMSNPFGEKESQSPDFNFQARPAAVKAR